MSSQRSFMQKKEKKLLKRFWDWPFPPLKVDDATDADADDGRVGIWKAPLPGGTAELKKRKSYWSVSEIGPSPP